ncbi:MAG: hypothetical protein LUE17_08840 [Planctomycetaceae bacterium]|nr:hypothetical protein [Planctomycetaceae bacterium]
MAKDGRKLELYEILAAKRAKGKAPLGNDAKPAKQANSLEPEPEITDAPGIIIDDAVRPEIDFAPPEPAASRPERETVNQPPPQAQARPAPAFRREPEPVGSDFKEAREAKPAKRERPAPPPEFIEPAPEPRPKSPREVVFALDTALICFTIVLALVGSTYFIGYKRGQEERPAGLAGVSEIEIADPNRLSIRDLTPPPRAAFRPPETDFTLIIRKEPATDDLPERLELELAEALARGRREAGRDFPGFIFRTGGNDPHFILAVGLGQSANDAELSRLLQVYNVMEGVTLSRQPRPYLGCRIAPIRELGTPVY